MAMRIATTMTGMLEADAGYRPVMADRQAWDLAFDPATGFRRTQEEAGASNLLPSRQWPNFFSRVVARLQWDARAIDLAPDAAAWPELADARRARLTTLLAGFRVAEDAVAEHIAPFGEAANNSLVAWVLYLQRRDEQRHAVMFDRIAAEVLKLPGDTADERLDAAREHAPAGVLELFEERLPAMAGELAAGRTRVDAGIGLYHMILEGIVLLSGQRALVADLEDGALPGVLEGVERVEKDERWHIGFGLRCLIDAKPSAELVDEMLASAEDASGAWGDAVPKEIRESVVPMCRRRLSIAKLLDPRSAAAV
jgi:ribonucleoside-diphosphate reductase beta chain